MNHEQYQEKITNINIKLSTISERTLKMAFVRSANIDNPEFLSLMNQFDELVKASDELTEKMISLSSTDG